MPQGNETIMIVGKLKTKINQRMTEGETRWPNCETNSETVHVDALFWKYDTIFRVGMIIEAVEKEEVVCVHEDLTNRRVLSVAVSHRLLHRGMIDFHRLKAWIRSLADCDLAVPETIVRQRCDRACAEARKRVELQKERWLPTIHEWLQWQLTFLPERSEWSCSWQC